MKKTTEIKCSENLKIRLLQASDAQEIYETIHSQRNYKGSWLRIDKKQFNLKSTETFVSNITKQKAPIKDLIYLIYYKNKFAGMIGLLNIDHDNNKAEIGYWIKEDMEYLGLSTETTSKFMEHCFNTLNFNRICIKISTNDYKSNNVPKKLGFEIEGTERQGLKSTNGQYMDLFVYSMLKKEYDIKLMFYRRSTKLRNNI